MPGKFLRCLVTLLALAVLTGCDTGVQHMGTTEYGVRFRKLPRLLGGGIAGAGSVASPLQTVVVMPWESIYRFDTSPQYLSWGSGMGEGGSSVQLVQNEDVYTRARDGNEAALKLTVRYRIKPDPKTLVWLAQNVATSSDQVRDLVVSVVGAEIRTHMNALRTAEYRDDKKRNDTVDETLGATKERLGPLGIEVEAINLKQYRFVRLRPDGKEDTSYQDRLREIQEREQDIEGERSRIETVRAKKAKELLEAESVYNRRISEAKGYKDQSAYEGDGYYAARANEAKAILAEGSAETEGLRQQVAAVSGKGGQAMLKLEVAKQLAKANPRFVAINPGNGSTSLDLQKMDMNQLLRQLGVTESLGGDRGPSRNDALVKGNIPGPETKGPEQSEGEQNGK
jgi:hypothetical protein